MGHTDRLLIADAGLAIPDSTRVIDLSLAENVPTAVDVLKELLKHFSVEGIILSQATLDVARWPRPTPWAVSPTHPPVSLCPTAWACRSAATVPMSPTASLWQSSIPLLPGIPIPPLSTSSPR